MPASALRAISALLLCAPSVFSATYYVDCAGGDDRGSGREPASAWRTLQKLNGAEFAPGDAIRLKRGAVCEGALWPKGSGAAGNPITLGAFGVGAMPVIKANGQAAAITLLNQHDWEIRGIAATGSTEYGIHVSGSGLARLRLIDCLIHGVNSTGKMNAKASGLVVFDGELEDVVVDGVTAYDTNRWAGIFLQGRRRSSNVVVRNSTVHNVYGDGIVLFAVRDGVIERSAAWYTGLEPSYSIGTPNSIWTWSCANCVVRQTEGFYSDSPGVDGGVYDIDWGDSNNLVENNYGHDSQAYCVSVFGAGSVTKASEVRGNICVGTGRSPRAALRHGDVFVYTWNMGALDGVRIHDNTFLWFPPIDSPVLKIDAEFAGTAANSFDHNLIETSVPWMLDTTGDKVALDGNRYVYSGGGLWIWKGMRFAGLAEFRKGSGQEATGGVLGGESPCPTNQQGAQKQGRADISACQPASRSIPPELTAAHLDWKTMRGQYALISILDSSADSRGEAVVLRSAAAQYGRHGLKTIALSTAGVPTEWNLEGVQTLAKPLPGGKAPLTFLIDPNGRMRYRWEGYASAREVVFAIRTLLGPPSRAD